MKKRKMSRSRQDYTEEELYPDEKLREYWKKRDRGSLFSDSLVGGESQYQQNSWQGSQEPVKGEEP